MDASRSLPNGVGRSALKLRVLLFMTILSTNAIPTFAFNIGYHYELIREAMIQKDLAFNLDAYSVALAGNSYTDTLQDENAEYLIGDDFCEVSRTVVKNMHFDRMYDYDMADRYWRQLIQNTHDAVIRAKDNNDPLSLLLVIGISMHIVQDFYSHSNWAELDVGRLANKKDASYFDGITYQGGSRPIDDAILRYAFLPFRRYHPNLEGGLFSQGSGVPEPPIPGILDPTVIIFDYWSSCAVPHPEHDVMKKDHAAMPYFEWAYRSAYRASVQWLKLIEHWVNDPALWNNLQNYDFPGSKSDLYTLTSFDEGTIRWIHTYGGAWKTPARWLISDMIGDDLPNVPGIGLTEQETQGYPFLGVEWFENAFYVGRNLFQSKTIHDPEYGHLVIRLNPTITGLEEGKEHPGYFGDYVKVELDGDDDEKFSASNIPLIDNDVIRDALYFLGFCLNDSGYEGVKWLRLRIPYVDNMDCGDGILNVDNEEWAGEGGWGAADYWPTFIIDGLWYSEAEYTDENHPYTLWGALKPIWDDQPVYINIIIYESDIADHKDHRMQLTSTGGDLTFGFDPLTGQLLNLPPRTEAYTTSTGWYLMTEGADSEWGVRVFCEAGIMSDNRAEFILRTHKDNNDATDDNVFVSVGSYVWYLDHPNYNDFERADIHTGWMWVAPTLSWQKIYTKDCRNDIYTFDPGQYWDTTKMYELVVIKDGGSDGNSATDGLHVEKADIKSEDVCKGSDPAGAGAWLDPEDGLLSWEAVSKSSIPSITTAPPEIQHQAAKYFTVKTGTANAHQAGTNDDVYVSFLDGYGNVLTRYLLDNFQRDDFERGNTDFFWLQYQLNRKGIPDANAGFFCDQIENIRIEKPENEENGDWDLADLEIWVNDMLLYRGNPNTTLNGSNSSITIDVWPPTTTASLDPAQPDGCNGYYVTPVTFTLSATDQGSGVKQTVYKIDNGEWQVYSTPVVIDYECEHDFYYKSQDNTGNWEGEKSVHVKVDLTPPAITINSPQNTTYTHADIITLDFAIAIDTCSGTATSKAILSYRDSCDCNLEAITKEVKNGEQIDVFWLALEPPPSSLEVESEDNACQKNTQSIQFNVISTIDSMFACTNKCRQINWITKDGIRNSLIAKLAEAKKNQILGKKKTVANIMRAYINEVEKGLAFQQINMKGYCHLTQDANYVVQHL